MPGSYTAGGSFTIGTMTTWWIASAGGGGLPLCASASSSRTRIQSDSRRPRPDERAGCRCASRDASSRSSPSMRAIQSVVRSTESRR